MKKKREKIINLVIFTFFLISFSFFLLPSVNAQTCSSCKNGQCNDICEIGEDINYCRDCTSAYCGNSKCDPGKGENSDNCWKDCPKANGESCDFDKECLSRHFCGGSVIKFMIN